MVDREGIKHNPDLKEAISGGKNAIFGDRDRCAPR